MPAEAADKTVSAGCRTLSAWWRRYDVHVAVLLAHVEPVTTSRGGPPDDLAVIGLARAEGGPRRRGSGTQEVTIGQWIVLPAPVPLRRLTDPLPSRHRTKIWEIAYGTAAAARRRSSVAHDLGERDRQLDDTAARLADRQAPSQRARSETRTALRYDTVTTALRLFDPSWRQLAPVETPTERRPR
jgi:hypothetical protein